MHPQILVYKSSLHHHAPADHACRDFSASLAPTARWSEGKLSSGMGGKSVTCVQGKPACGCHGSFALQIISFQLYLPGTSQCSFPPFPQVAKWPLCPPVPYTLPFFSPALVLTQPPSTFLPGSHLPKAWWPKPWLEVALPHLSRASGLPPSPSPAVGQPQSLR
jgi:hypothetical protein